jgi:hypothetical protein
METPVTYTASALAAMTEDVMAHFSDNWKVTVRRTVKTVNTDTGMSTASTTEWTEVPAMRLNFKEEKINARGVDDELLQRGDIRIALLASSVTQRPDTKTIIIDEDTSESYRVIQLLNTKPGSTPVYYDCHARSVS